VEAAGMMERWVWSCVASTGSPVRYRLSKNGVCQPRVVTLAVLPRPQMGQVSLQTCPNFSRSVSSYIST